MRLSSSGKDSDNCILVDDLMDAQKSTEVIDVDGLDDESMTVIDVDGVDVPKSGDDNGVDACKLMDIVDVDGVDSDDVNIPAVKVTEPVGNNNTQQTSSATEHPTTTTTSEPGTSGNSTDYTAQENHVNGDEHPSSTSPSFMRPNIEQLSPHVNFNFDGPSPPLSPSITSTSVVHNELSQNAFHASDVFAPEEPMATQLPPTSNYNALGGFNCSPGSFILPLSPSRRISFVNPRDISLSPSLEPPQVSQPRVLHGRLFNIFGTNDNDDSDDDLRMPIFLLFRSILTFL